MKNLLLLSSISGLILAIIFAACKQEEEINQSPQSSWEIIQSQILEPNCVTCHESGTSFARQSDLILTKELAFDQLINRQPNNQAARNDGLELVGTKGLESLYNSFLWEKINTHDFEHYYEDHPEYGELMPLGGPSLTDGELEYIEAWIKAGAPENGFPVANSVLENTNRFEFPEEEYIGLPQPEQGMQLNIGPFDVDPNFEREFFYYQPLNNDQEILINRVEITMRKGSHHFILYDFPELDFPESETFRDFRSSTEALNFNTIASIVNQRFVFGTQWRNIDYQFPEGVALKVPANWGFDLNSHYVNRSNESMQGEVAINLHTVDKSEVVFEAQNIFLNNTQFSLPPQQVSTVEKTWTFNERRYIFQLFSHAHEHMTEFKIFITGGPRDGELVYFAKDWEHPPLLELDPPIILEAGEGLKAETTYNNNTDRTLQFGLFSVDEMMIILGAYYTD